MATSHNNTQHSPAQRLLVVMPNWLGDCVMATPALRALRRLYPDAHITALMRRNLRAILDACPYIDRVVTVRARSTKGKVQRKATGFVRLSRRLASAKFDTAVLLPNSFRHALLVRLAGIKRRVGYDRDGRGTLLTDRLVPRRAGGQYVPVSARDYYLGIARYLGAVNPDPAMELFTRQRDDESVRAMLTEQGWDPSVDPATGRPRRPFIVVNPGAAFGETKLWSPQRFAEIADRCADQYNALVAINGGPGERPIIDRMLAAAKHKHLNLAAIHMPIGPLKSVIRSANLMISNDTGPRHIACAFGVPGVCLFGPIDPAWSDTGFERERQIAIDVYCRPCNKKRCPLRDTPEDHQCMKLIDVEMVWRHVEELYEDVCRRARGVKEGSLN
ncbi:MAG: lipopolysaccharide heptosyltransferase II [Phycisphaeraceae bacterium]